MSSEILERPDVGEQVADISDFNALERKRHEEIETSKHEDDNRVEASELPNKTPEQELREKLDFTPRKTSVVDRLRHFLHIESSKKNTDHPFDQQIHERLKRYTGTRAQEGEAEGHINSEGDVESNTLTKPASREEHLGRIRENREKYVGVPRARQEEQVTKEQPVGIKSDKDGEDEVQHIDIMNRQARIKTAGEMASRGDGEGIGKMNELFKAQNKGDNVNDAENETSNSAEQNVVPDAHYERMQRDKRLFDSVRHQVMHERNKGDKNFDDVFSEVWKRIIKYYQDQGNESETNRMKMLLRDYPEGFPKGYGERRGEVKDITSGKDFGQNKSNESKEAEQEIRTQSEETDIRTNPVLEKYLRDVRRVLDLDSSTSDGGQVMQNVVAEGKKIEVPELKPIEKKTDRKFFGVKRK